MQAVQQPQPVKPLPKPAIPSANKPKPNTKPKSEKRWVFDVGFGQWWQRT